MKKKLDNIKGKYPSTKEKRVIVDKNLQRIRTQFEQIVSTDSFQYFDQDCLNCLEPWQYHEPADLSNKDRFDLDIEAYKKTFFGTAHIHQLEFNEMTLLEILIKKLEPAKHPVFIEYKEYLKNELKKHFSNESKPKNEIKDYKDEDWFKVGLLFANGEMDELKTQFNSNATQIAIHLGNKSYRPYISATLNNSSPEAKNLFLNHDKLLKIYNHCIKNNIPMIDSFKGRIQPD